MVVTSAVRHRSRQAYIQAYERLKLALRPGMRMWPYGQVCGCVYLDFTVARSVLCCCSLVDYYTLLRDAEKVVCCSFDSPPTPLV